MYQSNKNYSWQAEDQFTLSGKEFESLSNLALFLSAKLATEEAQELIRIYETYKTTIELMNKYIEKGTIKESEKAS